MKQIAFIFLIIATAAPAQQTSGTDKLLETTDAVVETVKSIRNIFKKKDKNKTEEGEIHTSSENNEVSMASSQKNDESIEFYNLLDLLIPETGKTAFVDNIDKNSKAFKLYTADQDGIFLSGEANITFDGTAICEDKYCSWIDLILNKDVKTYRSINIELNIEHHEEIYTQFLDDGNLNTELLNSILGKKDFTSKFIPDKYNNALQYEFSMPGKNKVWMDLKVAYYNFKNATDQDTPRLYISIYLNKADFDQLNQF